EIAARFGRRTGSELERLSFSTGYQQMEQDRASVIQFHYQELAWASADSLRGHRESDRQHNHESRPHGPRGVRYTQLRNRHRGQRRGTGTAPDHSCAISWRLELHNQTKALAL